MHSDLPKLDLPKLDLPTHNLPTTICRITICRNRTNRQIAQKVTNCRLGMTPSLSAGRVTRCSLTLANLRSSVYFSTVCHCSSAEMFSANRTSPLIYKVSQEVKHFVKKIYNGKNVKHKINFGCFNKEKSSSSRKWKKTKFMCAFYFCFITSSQN